MASELPTREARHRRGLYAVAVLMVVFYAALAALLFPLLANEVQRRTLPTAWGLLLGMFKPYPVVKTAEGPGP